MMSAFRPLRLLASAQNQQSHKIRSLSSAVSFSSVSVAPAAARRCPGVGGSSSTYCCIKALRTTQSFLMYQPLSTITKVHMGSLSHLAGFGTGVSGATSISLVQQQQQRQMHSNSRPPQPPRNRITAGLASIGTAGMLLAGKGKYLLGALKLTKFASLGSMLVTVGTYSMFYGWPFATGMVGLILVHESGHALMMHRLGIPFKPMVFVPFLGAAVAMKERPRDAYDEALVAFGGPVLGSIGAAGVFAAGVANNSNLLIALGDFGFMINLFNLLPIGMMDGGRICGAVSPYAGVIGLGIGGTMVYNGMIANPIFYLILLAGGWETFQKFYNPAQHVPPNYYAISGAQRAAITGGYFALVAALFTAMSVSSAMKKTPEQLQRERQLGVYHHPDEY
mmetsp:Transcript_33086/g.97615  ORF Transcript_33086/g.97615 Transcript_33086/m.97615 type:complete len:393 (-) Transcript_33086:145-1323(-)